MGRRRLARCPAQRAFRRMREAELWSLEEKQSLLEAMRKHGLMDFEALRRAVPRRTEVELRNFLAARKAEGVYNMKDPNQEAPLDSWLTALSALDSHGGLKPNRSRTLAQVLAIMADTEPQPPPELCGGVDFCELYNYLSELMYGSPPKDISAPSARFLMECCTLLSDLVDSGKLTPHMEFLQKTARLPSSGLSSFSTNQTYSQQTNKKPISKIPLLREKFEKRVVQEVRDGRIMNVTKVEVNNDFNPLCIPDKLLQLEKLPIYNIGRCTSVPTTSNNERHENSQSEVISDKVLEVPKRKKYAHFCPHKYRK